LRLIWRIDHFHGGFTLCCKVRVDQLAHEVARHLRGLPGVDRYERHPDNASRNQLNANVIAQSIDEIGSR
jgi:hypothetical protein